MRVIVAALALLISSCATAPTAPSPPQVVAIDRPVSLSELKGVALNLYLADGWTLEKESDHMLTFISENSSVTARVLLGSQYDTRVFYRENLVLAPSATGVTLRTSQVLVSNHGSAFERVTPVEGKGGNRLAQIKESFATSTIKITDNSIGDPSVESLLNGTATLKTLTLTSGYTVAFKEGAAVKDWRRLHDDKRWRELASAVLQVGSGSDLSWFYLGRCAEELGHPSAATIYYKKSIEASSKKLISACIGVVCSGFNFPEDAERRLTQLTSR
jgi:hypothetical protein